MRLYYKTNKQFLQQRDLKGIIFYAFYKLAILTSKFDEVKVPISIQCLRVFTVMKMSQLY